MCLRGARGKRADMLTQEEKANLTTTSRTISDLIDGMIKVINCMSNKQEIFTKLIENSQKIAYKDAIAQLERLIEVKSELGEIRNKVDILLDVDTDISEVYQSFLQGEFVVFDWNNNLMFTNVYQISHFIEFIERQNNTIIKPADVRVANQVMLLPEYYTNNLNILKDKFAALVIFDKIKNITGNIVMIGANGSGKSTFSRQLRGKISTRGMSILSAQRLLIYSRANAIPSSGNEVNSIRSYQQRDKLSSEHNLIHDITSDLNNLVNALLSQHIQSSVRYQAGNPKEETLLEKTMGLWHELIEHRSLVITESSLSVETPDKQQYAFNNLSDGEKAAFYYIGHVLLASENSYILVDEPENHLHLAICNKLWDKLEAWRTDCSFIYLTHNLDFAMSRTNATTIWNKQFIAPSQWDFEILESDTIIPDGLLMELVGSRRKICFCEGQNKDSLDYKLYSILLNEYTIITAGGHREVIDYTCAYNQSRLFNREAIGIIDGDYHLPKQLTSWAEKRVYALSVNEVENLLCDEIILSAAVEQFHSGDEALSNYLNKFWECLEEDKEQQAVWFVNNYLNNKFKQNFLNEKSDIDSLKTELHQITSDDEIDRLYTERIQTLSDIIRKKDYQEGLRIANFKGKLTKYIAKNTIVDKYVDRVLDMLKKDSKLSASVREKYFAFLLEQHNPSIIP